MTGVQTCALPISVRRCCVYAMLLMQRSLLSITFENRSAGMRSAALSAVPALFTPLVIPICCWSGLRLRFPPSSFVSSFATLPHNSPVCSRSMPKRYGLNPPTRNRRLFKLAAKSKPPTSNVQWPLPALFDSINCANRSWINPNAHGGPLNSPSSALAERVPSSIKTASTVCLSPVR